MRTAAAKSLVASMVLAAFVLCLPPDAWSAETFLLKTGGRIEGEWLNRRENPRETFIIRTNTGGVLSFDRHLVERVLEQSPDEMLYEQIRHTYPDTVAGHEALAKWCLEKELHPQRRVHLERIIELDRNHQEARAALGYTKEAGEWLTRDELMASRGMIMYRGRYRTRQEIEIWERERKAELAEKEWYRRLKMWRDWLDSADKFAAGVENIKQVKLLLIDVLAQIPALAADRLLVERSLKDQDQEVRLSCLDQVVEKKTPAILQMYISALKSKDNIEVNRAALALREVGDKDAIPALLDALVTEHKYVINTGNPGQMTSTFNPRGGGGGGGLTFGGGGPKIIKRDLQNKAVRDALIVLTEGQNFGYEVEDWKRWYASSQRASTLDARRD